jgi:hypothetical protein
VIDFLLHIALGDGLWHYPYGYRPEFGVGAYMSREFADELYACVQKLAFPVFLSLATVEGDEETQRMALWSLGWFPERDKEARPVLEQSQSVAAPFALRMLNACKNSIGERSEEQVEHDSDEYDELISQIYG